jgi:hypothetical protein
MIRTTSDLVSALNHYKQVKADILDRLSQDLVIGSGLENKKSLKQCFYNFVLIEHLNFMDADN